MSRRLWLAGGVALTVLAGGVAWALAAASSAQDGSDAGGDAAGTTTAVVSRRDLVERESFDGTLGYADTRVLAAARGRTVTRLREEGAVVRQGQALYWLDGKPVTLMYGETPAWRRLDASSEDGKDIRQLEWNLVALGYDPDRDVEIDGEWDWATTAAVKRWQEDAGLAEDGAVDLGEVVFLPGPRRVGALEVTLGAAVQPGVEVMDTSSTTRVVTLELDAERQDLVSEGEKVRVQLPGGRTVEGRIVEVGKVAESETDAQGNESEPTIDVEIRLTGPARGTGLDQAPVDVEIAKETRRNVLTVPVSALVALPGGGYAVEVVSGGGTRLVRVEPGLSADGLVEVSGKGLREGMRVVVPR